MPEQFILIPGRTSRQCGISEGKYGKNYQEEINILQVAPEDMERLGLAEGTACRSPATRVKLK
jgi:formylmethanofuran dehydrogenase subunit D